MSVSLRLHEGRSSRRDLVIDKTLFPIKCFTGEIISDKAVFQTFYFKCFAYLS